MSTMERPVGPEVAQWQFGHVLSDGVALFILTVINIYNKMKLVLEELFMPYSTKGEA